MNNRRACGFFYPVTPELKISSLDEGYEGSVLECDRLRPQVIEGADIFDTLCPMNKFNGHRDNPLSLLGKITGADSQLLQSVLQELPTVFNDPSMTDDDRVNYLVPRLSSGTPAEASIVAEHLMNNLDALGMSQKRAQAVVESQQKQTIEFDNKDVPNAE